MKLPLDKQLHFAYGQNISEITIVASMICFWISGYNQYSFEISLALGVIMSMLAGAIKEWLDSKGSGTVDINDFYATALGGIYKCAPLLVIAFLIRCSN